jgi:hypothetical protein
MLPGCTVRCICVFWIKCLSLGLKAFLAKELGLVMSAPLEDVDRWQLLLAVNELNCVTLHDS